jgi:ABC-type multidrug transport system fused ATPase/permease subunit
MLEVFAVAKVYQNFSKKEKFEDSTYGGNKKNQKSDASFFGIFFLIIFLSLITIPITIAACYLSWTSNTLIEWGTGFKVLFAFFAFLAPVNYLFSHLIHKYDLLTHIEKQKMGTVFNNIQ